LNEDARWMGAAIALGERGRGLTAPNPNVGCVIVRDGRIVGRGWTQKGGRPHAEAMALADAGGSARGAHAFVTLEPCCHASPRGPACADLLIEAGIAGITIATEDPDPRMRGGGVRRLEEAGIPAHTAGSHHQAASRSMSGFLARVRLGRPLVTLKLATSLDGRIAMASGESRWITGIDARAHGHLERARSDAILVGRGTYESDSPRLDVRLGGLEDRSPRRILLTRGDRVPGWESLDSPERILSLDGVNDLLVEGGAGTAAAFLQADLVDRLLLYRAPVLIGEGKPALGGIGLESLAEAHGRWRFSDGRMLGADRLEVYLRIRGDADSPTPPR
jgi:diaminohydroxyphosphoribosylaminopyrimidine deaminase/5-amino-6-(5-phosphoribosylamino)uracil reductase